MKTLSLKLPESLAARLTAAARRSGRTKSALVREVLEEYLANEKPAAGGSHMELIADLVGCIEGPRDLSFNKKYMRGYGK